MKEGVLDYFERELRPFGGGIYEYAGNKFIGVKNPFSDNNLVITFGEEEFTMEFTCQASRFSYGDENFAVETVKKYLNDEFVAVEVYLNGKSVFGGTRNSLGSDFKGGDGFALWYACGNRETADRIAEFLKNDGVEVRIFCWSGVYDRIFRNEK